MPGAESLRSKPLIHGFWCTTGDESVIDTAAAAGPDFMCLDTQHGVDLGRLGSSSFTVMASYGVPGLVRVESIDLGRIGRALDLGAVGIIVPLVETAEDAEKAVHATRHAPTGGRSFGMQTSRIGPFEERPYVVIQVETAAAVDNIESIAAVPGVDALYIGPADLGLAMGGVPAPDTDEVLEGAHENAASLGSAFRSVIDAAERHGVSPGLHCGSGDSAARAVAAGFTMTSVTSDLGLIGSGLGEQLRRARRA
jgi:4-hydroxy-2-oxoheptanedioate aldolase